jgi:hypothetical protein
VASDSAPHPLSRTDQGFSSWLRELVPQASEQQPPEIGPRHAIRLQLGDAALLYATESRTEVFAVDLCAADARPVPVLTGAVQQDWETLRSDMVATRVNRGAADDQDLVVSAHSLAFPLTDAPFLVLRYRSDPYTLVRSFHTVLSDKRAWEQAARDAASYESSERNAWPGILSIQIALRIRGNDPNVSVQLPRRWRHPRVALEERNESVDGGHTVLAGRGQVAA